MIPLAAPWQRNFRRTGFGGYDSTLCDHYNYATSWRLLMVILLPHLIAPADCFRRFSWVLSKKREWTTRVCAQNDQIASSSWTSFLLFARKNVEVPIYYKLFLCATAANLILTFCRNFRKFSCTLYNYRAFHQKIIIRKTIRGLLCVQQQTIRNNCSTFYRIGISIYCKVARILVASKYVPRTFILSSNDFFVLISLNFFHEMRDLQFSILRIKKQEK